jgi:hypothetical protein
MTIDPTYNNPATMREKAEALRNDKEQHSTYHSQAVATQGQELGGRFSHLVRGQQHVVGTAPIAYPAQPPGSPWGNSYILPDEPALGVDLEAVPDMLTVDGSPRAEPLPPEELPKPETKYVPEQLTAEGFRRKF